MSGKDMGIPIYSPWNGKKKYLQKSTAWERYGFSAEYFHVIGNLFFPRHRGLYGFSSTLNLEGRAEPGNYLCFPILPVIWKFTHPIVWELYGFLLHVKYVRNPYAWNICVFSNFPVLCEFNFPIFWKLYRFLLHKKCLRNPKFLNVCVFPCSSRTMGIHIPCVLEIVWIFASREIFKKLIIFECSCFPILFPYYENSLFPCFGNFMDFCLTQNM